VHEQKIDILRVVNKEGLVARRHHMSSLLIAAIANRWHSSLALEASTDTIVDALWLAPCGRYTLEEVGLMSVEALRALLDDRNMLLSGDHLVAAIKVSLVFFFLKG